MAAQENQHQSLGLSPEVFARNLAQVNNAYQNIVDLGLGPFYGENIRGQSPSFRVAAQSLLLPAHLKDSYT